MPSHPPFIFEVVSKPGRVPETAKWKAVLLEDNWDDWGKYRTQFVLFVFDAKGGRHELGGVKIGQKGLAPGSTAEPGHRRVPAVPRQFPSLPPEFFSLGQDDSYYEELGAFPLALRTVILEGLRDLVASDDLLQEVIDEDVVQHSLMRHVTISSIKGQYRRLLGGGRRLTAFNFAYVIAKRTEDEEAVELGFKVKPDSMPPTNVHVLIGRNGVGKTYTLHQMAVALLGGDTTNLFKIRAPAPDDFVPPFSHLISVSFSAFDEFKLPTGIQAERNRGMRYTYIGLRKADGKENGVAKDPDELCNEFTESALVCSREPRLGRWRRLLEILESDRLFLRLQIQSELAPEATDDEDSFRKKSAQLFRGLSSGHKIVLLTTARMVEAVEEKSLVLIDEPESHLHPPLLAAFVRSLSELLVNRNGVAVVATHSPVVLQEVPQSCVWKLDLHGSSARAARPKIETFGENVGVLTREVFGLEVSQTGFNKMLESVSDKAVSYEGALEAFNEQLGGEARAILRGLMLAKGK